MVHPSTFNGKITLHVCLNHDGTRKKFNKGNCVQRVQQTNTVFGWVNT